MPPTDAPPLLFTPIALRHVTARNRLVVSPMCQYVSVDGAPTDWQFVHFGRYAMGGAGIVFGEETAMPAFYRIDGLNRVRPEFVGKPILTARQVEDVVAYLATMK